MRTRIEIIRENECRDYTVGQTGDVTGYVVLQNNVYAVVAIGETLTTVSLYDLKVIGVTV